MNLLFGIISFKKERYKNNYLFFALSLSLVFGCLGCFGARDGQDGSSCSVEEQDDETVVIVCDDGSSVFLYAQTGQDGQDGEDGKDGQDGEDRLPGESCTIIDNNDNSYTIECPDDTYTTIVNPEKNVKIKRIEGNAPASEEVEGTYSLLIDFEDIGEGFSISNTSILSFRQYFYFEEHNAGIWIASDSDWIKRLAIGSHVIIDYSEEVVSLVENQPFELWLLRELE